MTASALDAVHRVASAARLLVALDFDGTLAPTVDDPATSRALPGAVAAISELSRVPDTLVAIVSGRHLASLQEVLTVPSNVVLIGSHGAEVLMGGTITQPTLSPDERELLESVCVELEKVAAQFLGSMVERKHSGCGFHTRLVSPQDAHVARERALVAVHAIKSPAHVTERYGKDIVEFTVRSADKGSAVQWLREQYEPSHVVFFGDDVTDEDAFRTLSAGDVGVKVGEGASEAEFRVADPDAAVRLLSVLAKARREPRE